MGISLYLIEILSGDLRQKLIRQLDNLSKHQGCPFLIDNSCSIHPIRPIACRQFNVFRKKCTETEDAYYSRRKDVLTPIKKYTDQALSIIPFEKDWFKNKNMDVDFVGHPFADMDMPTVSKNEYFKLHSLDMDKPLLTLMPGSRQQEIDRHWPIFLQTIEILNNTFPDLQFIVGKAPNITLGSIPPFVRIEKDNSQLALLHGTAGIAASGTATLEALVFKLPIIVCYKSSAITYWIGKRLSKVKYLSLINLIANRKIVHEFIQNDMSAKAMVKSIIPLLSDTPERDKLLSNYSAVNNKLGKTGVYQRAAKLISEKI